MKKKIKYLKIKVKRLKYKKRIKAVKKFMTKKDNFIYAKAIFYTILAFVVVTSALYALFTLKPRNVLPGYSAFSVESGSMEPKLLKGSLIFTKEEDEYQKGDVITYLQGGESYLTHRIVEVNKVDEENYYTTKGDANSANDSETVARNQIVGKLFIPIPFIGYLTAFSKTLTGLILIVILPSVLIIANEISVMKNEFSKLLTNKGKKRYFFIFFFMLLYSTGNRTNSLYLDSAKSTGTFVADTVLTDPVLDLYLRNDLKAAGFEIENIEYFDQLKYELTYDHNSLTELTQGDIKLNGQNSFTEEWIILGSCSSLGTVCVYYNDVDNLHLKVELLINGEVKSSLSKDL